MNTSQYLDPDHLANAQCQKTFSIPLGSQRELQETGIRARYESLRGRIRLLDQLSEQEGIKNIASVDDVVPLLLPHSAYKSYPLSFLEKGRFDLLTSWLDALTSFDISGVDTSGCECIDDWLLLLEKETPLRVAHSTGTSGKLSFIPRSEVEVKRQVEAFGRFFDPFEGEEQVLEGQAFNATPIIFPQYRKGAMTQHRMLDAMVKYLYDGDESMVITLNPGRFSADVASIGGRLKAAEGKGQSSNIFMSPKIRERRETYIREQENADSYIETLLEKMCSALSGRKVCIIGHPGMMLNFANRALQKGNEQVFDPTSFAMIGGGTKGMVLPEDWPETVKRFLGVRRMRTGYGMTEMIRTTARDCPEGHYHLPLSTVPFIQDFKTGEIKPRTGVQTGRFGFFDLLASTYWGGFWTSDEVTLSWGDSEPCKCGRKGAYLHPSIRRYTEAEGGDDKISCAGAPEVHDKAIDFIIRSGG